MLAKIKLISFHGNQYIQHKVNERAENRYFPYTGSIWDLISKSAKQKFGLISLPFGVYLYMPHNDILTLYKVNQKVK